jgi:rod shape-determining protein MreD
MNWIGLIAALLVAVLIQTTICPLADLPVVDVDLLLVLALVYGLVAPAQDARLAAFIIGFAVDLTTESALGLRAFGFGLTGLLITQLREITNQRIWWTRLLAGLLAAAPGQLLIVLHLRYIQGIELGNWWSLVFHAIVVAATAALLAALGTAVLRLGQPPHSQRRAAWKRP